MSDNVTSLNSHVDLDLDSVEAGLEQRRDMFVTRRGKVLNPDTSEYEDVQKRIRITDPNRVDWRILATLESNIEVFGHIVPEIEDKEFLRENPIPIEVLGILVDRIGKHFGMPEIGGRKTLPI